MNNITKLKKQKYTKSDGLVVIFISMFCLFVFSGCGVAKPSQKQNETKNDKHTELETVSVIENNEQFTKQDYAFLYRVFGNAKFIADNQNNTNVSDTSVNKNSILDSNRLNKIFDDKNMKLTKQDSAFVYRIFGDFKIISR